MLLCLQYGTRDASLTTSDGAVQLCSYVFSTGRTFSNDVRLISSCLGLLDCCYSGPAVVWDYSFCCFLSYCLLGFTGRYTPVEPMRPLCSGWTDHSGRTVRHTHHRCYGTLRTLACPFCGFMTGATPRSARPTVM